MGTLAFSLFVLLAWAIGLRRLAREAAVHANADLVDSHTENVTRTSAKEQ